MESIQLAQMLADLSDLDAAQEAAAAIALVNANKTLPATSAVTGGAPSQDQSLLKVPPTSSDSSRNHQRVGSTSVAIGRTASPAAAARFDKFGRRILTPPMTRSSSSHGSIPGTPRRDSENEDDVDRASTLMALYEIRAKIKQQDNSSLIKAREKIQALAAKQQAQLATERKDTHNRYVYPKQT